MRPLRFLAATAAALVTAVAVAQEPWPEAIHARRINGYEASHGRPEGDWNAFYTKISSAAGLGVEVDNGLRGQQDPDLGQVGAATLYVRAENVPTDVLMETIADAFGGDARYDARSNRVIFDQGAAQQQLRSVHAVDSRVLAAIPFALRQGGGGPQQRDLRERASAEQVQSFLAKMGVEMPRGSRVELQGNDALAVTTTARGQYQIADLLARLGGTPAPTPTEVSAPGRAQLQAAVLVAGARSGMRYAALTGDLASRGGTVMAEGESHTLSLESGVTTEARRTHESDSIVRESILTVSAVRMIADGGQIVARFDVAWRAQIPVAAEGRAPATVTLIDLQTTVDMRPDQPMIAAAVAVPMDTGRGAAAATGPTIYLLLSLSDLQAEQPPQTATASTAPAAVAAPASPYTPIHAPTYKTGETLQDLFRVLGAQLSAQRDPTRPDSFIHIGHVPDARRPWAGTGDDNQMNSIREGWQLHALRRGNTVILLDSSVAVEPLQTVILSTEGNDRTGPRQRFTQYRLPGVRMYPMPGIGKVILRAPAAIMAELDLPAEDAPAPADSSLPVGTRSYVAYIADVRDDRLAGMLSRDDGASDSRIRTELASTRQSSLTVLGLHGFVASAAAQSPRLDVHIAALDADVSQAYRMAATRVVVDGEPGVYTVKYAQLSERLPATIVDGRLVPRTDGGQVIAQNAAITPVTPDTRLWITDYLSRPTGQAIKLILDAQPDATAAATRDSSNRPSRPGNGRWRREGEDDRDRPGRPSQNHDRPSQITPAPPAGTGTGTTPDWY